MLRTQLPLPLQFFHLSKDAYTENLCIIVA